MDRIVEDKDVLFDNLFKHLSEVEAEPATKILDEDLLRRLDRALDTSVPQVLLWRVLNTGENLLQILQQDSRPLTRVLESTVRFIPFDDLKPVISAQKLIDGLKSPSVPIELLCLAYLRKAADTPSGVSFVACSPELVKTLVATWLSSESTEVAERALEAIIEFLAVDSPTTVTLVASSQGIGEAEGQGLMWRRLFHDPEVYSLLFAWTSLVKSNHDLSNKKGAQAVTISQARLFDFIARVASFDWGAITSSKLPATEREYTKVNNGYNEQPYGGILKYAANGMIDSQDYLMEVLRQDFFVKLLNVVEEEKPQGLSQKMITAIQDGAGVQSHEETSANVDLPLRSAR